MNIPVILLNTVVDFFFKVKRKSVISCLAELLSASQEGLCSMQSVSLLVAWL